jgi:hypothetical protein
MNKLCFINEQIATDKLVVIMYQIVFLCDEVWTFSVKSCKVVVAV